MDKKLFLFVILFIFISCEGIHYDAEKRLVFQTKVVNSGNEPLANAHVEIAVAEGNYPYGGGLISQGMTDSNGNITLIFPSPDNYNSINLKIYSDDTTYLQKEISGINISNFVNYKFFFNNAYLLKEDETAVLNLSYAPNTAETVLEKVNINGIYTTFPDYYDIPFDNYNIPLPIQVFLKKNQSFELKYTLLNTQTHAETVQTVNLQIQNDPIEYTINY